MFNIWPECKKKVSFYSQFFKCEKKSLKWKEFLTWMQTKFHEFFFISGLRQAVMSNNHRSATVSPSSENSPSTEGGGGGHGHAPHPRSGGGYAQYSSQDSLPDSPYSSQSLDSQPAPGQGSFCTFFISAIFLHLWTRRILLAVLISSRKSEVSQNTNLEIDKYVVKLNWRIFWAKLEF